MAPTLIANVRLGLKWLGVTNALVYITAVFIRPVKIVIAQIPGACIIKPFMGIINYIAVS